MHALILPIAHVASSIELSEAAAAEIASYVAALKKCFEARGTALLTFERYMGSGSFEHMHLQVLPLPMQLASHAKAAFEAHGQHLGISFEVLPPGETVAQRLGDAPEPFFAVTLPEGETLLHRLRNNPRKHPLHFGREGAPDAVSHPRSRHSSAHYRFPELAAEPARDATCRRDTPAMFATHEPLY